MARFEPEPAEISAIEQTETAYYDESLEPVERRKLLRRLWLRLDRVHGSKVLRLLSHEDEEILNPLKS